MSIVIPFTLSIDLQIDEAFDAIVGFFIKQGYIKQSLNSPTNANLKAGRSDEIYTKERTVELSFKKFSNNETTIIIEYQFPLLLGSRVTHRRADEEIAVLAKFIESKQSLPISNKAVHRETIIERQIVKVKCRYCGALNNDGKMRCESCGALL